MALETSLAGVVLLVTALDGGLSSYGSGIVLDTKGFVLTNLHVLEGAKAVYALPWNPDQPSYAAVDGGLQRLVFEREKELVPVTLISADPVLDLAVVRLDEPTPVIPMKLRTAEVSIGDGVIAVGHPEQNFWTVTRGQVSGKHQGLIQHDAAVNKGNSGGPLLDVATGEVLGINTSFLKGAQGIYYARPVALASKLVDHVQAPLVLDRSTPEKAVTSCARARELASPAYSQCVHWGSHYVWFRDVLLASLRADSDVVAIMQKYDSKLRGGPKSRARNTILQWLEKGDGRPDVWSKMYGPFAMAWTLTDDPAALGKEADTFAQYIQDGTRGGKPPKVRPRSKSRDMKPQELRDDVALLNKRIQASESGDFDRKTRQTIKEKTGLKAEIDDGPTLRRTLKMGLRAERTSIQGDRAWVEVKGRNIDGSPYRYSVYLSRQADGWRESMPIEADWATGKLRPPEGYAMPLWFSAMPLGVLTMYAISDLVEHSIADRAEGVAWDYNFEQRWPALIDLMRADLADTRSLAEMSKLQ